MIIAHDLIIIKFNYLLKQEEAILSHHPMSQRASSSRVMIDPCALNFRSATFAPPPARRPRCLRRAARAAALRAWWLAAAYLRLQLLCKGVTTSNTHWAAPTSSRPVTHVRTA